MSKDKQRKYGDRELLTKIWPYFIQNKKYLFSVIFFMVSTIFITVYLPLVASEIIDDAIARNNENLLLILVGLYLGLISLSMIIEYIARFFIAIIGESAILKLRQDVFRKIQGHSQDYFDQTPTGDTVSRMTNDIGQMQPILSGQVIFSIIQAIQIVGMIIIMLQKSIILTLIAMIVIPLSILTMWLNKKFIRSEVAIANKEVGEVSAAITENIQGAKVSAAFARIEENTKEFEEINGRLAKTIYRLFRNAAIVGPIPSIISIMTIAFMFIAGALLSEKGVTGISVGVLFLFISYTQNLSEPVIQISAVFNQVQNAFASFERIVILIETPSSIIEKVNAVDLDINNAEIKMENIGFSYKEGEEKILDEFNLHIKSGEKIAIVGHTGAGKSTITRLINRIYDIQQGTIKIDEQDIRDVTLSSLRENIGVVLQEPILYSTTIRNNLSLTKEIDEELMNKILHLVGADFVNNLPKGLDTTVGERGSKLSLGEKQLISFARALVHDPPILFLDEATSSIDPQAELRIQRAMDEMLKDRTSIIIAHRLSTVKKADRIIVLSNGAILEEGTFEELLQIKGAFFELYKLQFNKSEPEKVISS